MNWLDRYYTDIGGKIKVLAKWCFFIEALSCVLSGVGATFYLLIAGMIEELYEAFLFIPLVPIAVILAIIAAWVSSWFIYALGELVERVCSIDDKLPPNDTAVITPAQNSKTAPSSMPKAPTASKADEWRCPNCGLIHKNYVGTCGCGTARPKSAAPQPPAPKPQAPAPQPEPKPAPTLKADEWYCPDCDVVHKNYVGSCGCGRKKP